VAFPPICGNAVAPICGNAVGIPMKRLSAEAF